MFLCVPGHGMLREVLPIIILRPPASSICRNLVRENISLAHLVRGLPDKSRSALDNVPRGQFAVRRFFFVNTLVL